MKKLKGLLLFILFTIHSCTEKYVPDVENIPSSLVVDALITNEMKQHVIYLSRATQYDSLTLAVENGATVYVEDNKKNRFYFKEKQLGAYFSDSVSFNVGTIYTLNIFTKDTKSYISTPQELLQPEDVGEIFNSKKSIEMYKRVSEKLELSTVHGAEFITPIQITTKPLSFYRYSNTILAEYTSKKDDELMQKYCWKKYNPNEYFNINILQLNQKETSQHDLGFFPFDTTFYEIVLDVYYPPLGPPIPIYTHKYLKNYIISIKRYHINENIHTYFNSINKQLESSQKFFDPIAAQVVGNIKCTSNPDIKAFGLFETSSVQLATYKVNINSKGESYELIKISPLDMDTISTSGENSYMPPKFWIQ